VAVPADEVVVMVVLLEVVAAMLAVMAMTTMTTVAAVTTMSTVLRRRNGGSECRCKADDGRRSEGEKGRTVQHWGYLLGRWASSWAIHALVGSLHRRVHGGPKKCGRAYSSRVHRNEFAAPVASKRNTCARRRCRSGQVAFDRAAS
jgi:hypothetical protein